MYANHYGPASPPPQAELSNNPFVGDPSTAHARFPDLTTSTLQSGYSSNGYQSPPQQYQQQQQQQQHPSQSYNPGVAYQSQPQMMSHQSQFAPATYAFQYPAQGQLGPQPTSIGSFQPTNGFPQALPHQYPVQSGYPYSSVSYSPQPSVVTTSAISEFDPYAQQSQTQNQSQVNQWSSGTGPAGEPHPRDLIRTHKPGLEVWDTYSWKQLFSGCDALKEAWSARKQQAESIVRQYGGHADAGLFDPGPTFGYNSQIEGWKQVLKDASNNFDTVTASTFQLHEVFNNYRHSGDQASKRRVRESCNAAMKGLPDWPSN